MQAVADPDFELRWGPGFGLLALTAFLPSVISSFFTQKKGGAMSPAPPLDMPLCKEYLGRKVKNMPGVHSYRN